MGLTDLQKPPGKQEFYRKIREAATNMDRLMYEWESLAEFIGNMDAADLDSLNVPAGTVRTDLINFRTLLNEFVSLYKNGGAGVTNVPDTIVGNVRGL